MASRARHTVFVYGTLKRGWNLAWRLDRQRFIGIARTAPLYRIFNTGTYPGLVAAEPGLAIEGELWRVDEACLAHLDVEEGIAEGLYARRPIVLLPPFHRSRVEAYFYLRTVDRLADCGERW